MKAYAEVAKAAKHIESALKIMNSKVVKNQVNRSSYMKQEYDTITGYLGSCRVIASEMSGEFKQTNENDNSVMGQLDQLFEGFDKVQYAKDMKRWKKIAEDFKYKAREIIAVDNKNNKGGYDVKIKIDHSDNMLTVYFNSDIPSRTPMPAATFKQAEARDNKCAAQLEKYVKRKYNMKEAFEDSSLENGSYFVVMR